VSNKSGPSTREAIERQAVDYLLALNGAPDETVRQQVAAWLRSDPAHAVAYARAERAWELADGLDKSEAATRSPTADEAKGKLLPPARLTRRRALTGGAIAATLAGLAGVGWFRQRDGIATAVGEIRDIRLPDGSVMHLNTNSRAVVRMTGSRRLVRLLQGEAFFDVAHDAARPFDVEMEGATVRALGTAFNIRVRAELVELTVTEGLVGVRTEKGMAEHVPAGQGAFIQPRTLALARLQDGEVEQRTLWRSKVIELNGESLGQAVDEFNRYRPEPIVIGDQRIAPLRVGGRFHIDEIDQFLAAVRQTLPVETIVQDDGRILLLYRPDDDVVPAGPGESSDA